MKSLSLNGKVINAAQLKRLDRSMVWVLTHEQRGETRFLGAYPSSGEAEQAAIEQFGHLKTDVIGYAPERLGVV